MRSWMVGVIAVVLVGHGDVSVAKPKAKPKPPVAVKLVKTECTGQRARCLGPNNVVGLVKDCLYEQAIADGSVIDSQFVCAVSCDPDTTTVPDALKCAPCKLSFADKVIYSSFDAVPAGPRKALASDLAALQAAASDEARLQLAADNAVAAAQQALADNPNSQALQEALGAAENVAKSIEDPTTMTSPDWAARDKRRSLERKVLDGLLANMAPLAKTCVFDVTPGFAWEIDGTYSGTPNLKEDKECKSTPTRDSFVNPMEMRTSNDAVTETVHGATFYSWNHKTGTITMSPTEEVVAELIHESVHMTQEGCGRPNLTTEGAATAAYHLNEIQAYVVSAATLFYRYVLSAASLKSLFTDPLEAQVEEFTQMATGKRKCSNGTTVDAPSLKISDDDRFYAGHWANGRPWFQQHILNPQSSESLGVANVFGWLCGPKFLCGDAASSKHELPSFTRACPLVAAPAK